MFGYFVEIFRLLNGLIILNLFALPLAALLIFYLTVMGASNPNKPVFLNVLGIVLAFVYGSQLGIFLWLIGVSKVFDSILQINSFAIAVVSWWGLVFAAVLLVIVGNIFIDNLYQFKQGNYGISFYAVLIIISYSVLLFWVGG